MGSHRVGHNWSDLAAAAADVNKFKLKKIKSTYFVPSTVGGTGIATMNITEFIQRWERNITFKELKEIQFSWSTECKKKSSRNGIRGVSRHHLMWVPGHHFNESEFYSRGNELKGF